MRKPITSKPEPADEQKRWGSPVVTALSLSLGLLSALLTVYVYLASRAEKVPVYCSESTVIVEPTRPTSKAIRILFGDKPVQRVTSTTIHFWNAGKKTIDGTDITKGDPLRIAVPTGAAVLSADLTRIYKPATGVRLGCKPNVVYVGFDFLDQLDGCDIQILHTGKVGQEWRVCGTLKGSCPIRSADPPPNPWTDTLVLCCLSVPPLLISVKISGLLRSKRHIPRKIAVCVVTYIVLARGLSIVFWRFVYPLFRTVRP